MKLHTSTTALLPTLTGPGLGVTIHATPIGGSPTKYDATLRVDHEGLAVLADRITETGTTRAGNGPTVTHRITAFDGQPGMLLTLVVKNGEVTGPRTPHLEKLAVDVYMPEGWAHIELSGTERLRLLQGSRWTVRFVLLPKTLVGDPGVNFAIQHRAWLSRTPHYVDGLPRPKPFTGLDHIKVDDEGPLFVIDQGGATSGNLVRVGDWGCELLHLEPHVAYDYAWDHLRMVESRQRGYLTLDGKPLTPADMPKGVKMAMGPVERLFKYEKGKPTPFGLDEVWIDANAHTILGSIDAAHDGRALQYAAFLAQHFGDQDAKDWLADHAAARRLETPTLLGLPQGQLTRAHAWGLTLQTLDWQINRTVAAREWMADAHDVFAAHQRENGGLCAWLFNKEADPYALDYKESVGLPRELEPVTRPEQEMLLAWSAAAAWPFGIAENVLRFTFSDCRPQGNRGPWERCGIDGERLSHGMTNFYSGNAIALGLHLGIYEAQNWLVDFCGGRTVLADQIAWLRSRPPLDLRNTFLLIGVLESMQ